MNGGVLILEKPPTREEMVALMWESVLDLWMELSEMIEDKYEMEPLWNRGGKAWTYEYKYRRGGKTLCTLHARANGFGCMVIFGKDERAKFEANREFYSLKIQKIYDEAKTYHDGKWVIFEMTDPSLPPDMEKLLLLKRKPNKYTKVNLRY